MSRRLIILIAGILLLVGISVAVIMLVERSPKLQNAVYKATNTVPTNTVVNTNTKLNTNQAVVAPDRANIQFVVRNFSEQYGSWSNQNGASNLVSAKQYASPSYAEYLDQQIAKTKATPIPAVYSGTVTKALVFNFLSLNTKNASVQVSTQQQVTTGTSTVTQTKELIVDLVKVGSDWKVNAAVWK